MTPLDRARKIVGIVFDAGRGNQLNSVRIPVRIVERVAAEIEAACAEATEQGIRYGIKQLGAYQDGFNAAKERAAEICVCREDCERIRNMEMGEK